MATELKEHEERSHSARYLILIFLVCVATCGFFFSAGFMVGRNERSLHSILPTEVVTTPGVVPPTVNPPPDSGAPATTGNPAAPNTAPESEVIPPGPEANPGPAAGKPAGTAPSTDQSAPKGDQPDPAPSAADLKKGVTLQVLAMHTKQDAESVVTVLKGKGYPVFLLTPENAHAEDSLYRVVVGPFKTREEAEKARDRLKEDGFKPFIRR